MTRTPPKFNQQNGTNGSRLPYKENDSQPPSPLIPVTPESNQRTERNGKLPSQKSSTKRTTSKVEKKMSGLSLRNRLLAAILPTVLMPLAIASWVGANITQNNAEEVITKQMEDRVMLSTSLLKSLPEKEKMQVLGNQLGYTGISGSQKLQVFDAAKNSVLNTVTEQGKLINAELVGGEAMMAIVRTIAQNPQATPTQFDKLLEPVAKQYDMKDFRVFHANNKSQSKILMAMFSHQGRYYVLGTVPDTTCIVVNSIDDRDVSTARGELLRTFAFLLGGLAVVATAVTLLLAKKLATPLKDLSASVERIGRGDLSLQIEPTGTIETRLLAKNFNNLLGKLKGLLQEQEELAAKANLFAEIASSPSYSEKDLEKTLKVALDKLREFTGTERAIIYRFNEAIPFGEASRQVFKTGKFLVESLASGYMSALSLDAKSVEIPASILDVAQKRKISAIGNISETDWEPESAGWLKRLQVRACLVAPLICQQKLYGLLMVHDCRQPRPWRSTEMGFSRQLAQQIEIVLERFSFIEQERIAKEQRVAKEQLQERILRLLLEVESVTQGDLSIRAKVTPDEIGTVAEFYNTTIESLQKLVAQVKTAAIKVRESTDRSQTVVDGLSQEAVKQASESWQALENLQTMMESIRAVSKNAEATEVAIRETAKTLEDGDRSMNRTVVGINSIQDTVEEVAEKLKELEHSTKKIANVVNLIDRFAAQTHLLALKASIEAARAGEKGQGFAVIAEEVRSLAAQSAQATATIENVVQSIRYQTEEVLSAMDSGTKQVAAGTKLVEETRQSLNAIKNSSGKVTELVREISRVTEDQSKTSEIVVQKMAEVTVSAQQNSQSATDVSNFFTELLVLAQDLQTGIAKFKV
jgi:methyl-accepting chemotaxis protein PixJ